MKFYRMSRIVPADGAGLFQVSHVVFELKTGAPMEDDFGPPLVCKLNKKFAKGKLPTFFESPALIARREFAQALVDAGVSNVEQMPVVIKDETHGREIDGYLFLNIVGRVACLNVDRSDSDELDEGMRVVDRAVLDAGRAPPAGLFLLDEDTDCMIVSERVHAALKAGRFDDVRFDEVELA